MAALRTSVMSLYEVSDIVRDTDQPIPVLGNKSPRAAAKTEKGRAKVVDWLKTLENHTAKSAGGNGEMASYSFSWLWRELGLNELRR